MRAGDEWEVGKQPFVGIGFEDRVTRLGGHLSNHKLKLFDCYSTMALVIAFVGSLELVGSAFLKTTCIYK